MKYSDRPNRVKHTETVPTQDDSRPNIEAPFERYMLNYCRECGRYKWVYCMVDLGDGKGPGYVCGKCRREAREARRSA